MFSLNINLQRHQIVGEKLNDSDFLLDEMNDEHELDRTPSFDESSKALSFNNTDDYKVRNKRN